MVRRREDEGGEELTEPQRLELVGRFSPLADGFFEDDSAFASGEHRRAAWEAHGDRLTQEFVRENPGRRPVAWWVLGHDRQPPTDYGDRPPNAPTDLALEAAVLWGMGELGAEERGQASGPSPAEEMQIADNEPWKSPTQQNGDHR